MSHCFCIVVLSVVIGAMQLFVYIVYIYCRLGSTERTFLIGSCDMTRKVCNINENIIKTN